ncbi:MAG: nuclear transport factor 2 family protein [Solirubrobacterales bacterium]
MSDWIQDYFADVDAMRLDEFVDRHTDDAVVSFNDNPPAEGKEQIRETIGGFWQMIDGLSHEIKSRYEDGDTVVLESDVHYTRKDGQEVTVKTASVLHRDGDKVDRLTFYNDPSPIFA